MKWKYIAHLSLEDWIRMSVKSIGMSYIIWKAHVKDFSIVGNSLAWTVENKSKVRIGGDCWVGGAENFGLL
jgi:hypothetical protein